MSLHLLECAANSDVPAAKKLVLMAFADSADSRTGIGFPGLEQAKRWANLSSDSHAKALVRQLVDEGFLQLHRRGHRGRRAEYVVFPNGCCQEHPIMEPDTTIGYSPTDPFSGANTVTQYPFSPVGADPVTPPQKGSGETRPNTQKGSGKGTAGQTPSLTTTTSPPSPRTSSVGATNDQQPNHPALVCPKHATATQENCRGCGTTYRQIKKRTQLELAADKRRSDQEAIEHYRRLRANVAAHQPANSVAIATALDETRETIRNTRQQQIRMTR